MNCCSSVCAELRNKGELTQATDTRHHIFWHANAFQKGFSASVWCVYVCVFASFLFSLSHDSLCDCVLAPHHFSKKQCSTSQC